MKRRISVAFLALLPCFGCLGLGADAPDVSGSGLDVVVTLRGDEPICPEASVRLELRDHEDRWLSQFDVALLSQAEDSMRRWKTGLLPRGVYQIETTVWGCKGHSTAMPAIHFRAGDESRDRLLALLVTTERSGIDVKWVGICATWDASDLLRLEPGPTPRLQNMSQTEYSACASPMGDVWQVEYLLDGSWGIHGIDEAFTWPRDTRTIRPGQELGLKRLPTVIEKGSVPASELPRRLRLRLAPPPEACAVSNDDLEQNPIQGCCDVFLVRWPESSK